MSLKHQKIQALNKRIWFGIGEEIAWPLPKELMGIELEAENVRNYGGDFLMMAGWSVDTDGSLRNQGREFVLRQPLSGTELSRAVHTLFKMQEADSPYRLQYTPNPRAGTHVHINWLEDTIGSAAALIALMYCIEPMLYSWVDEDRAWCSYCNPLSDLPASTLARLLNVEREDGLENPANHDPYEDDEQRWLLRDLNNETISRYHGLNVAALDKYGTFEFRYFPSTVSKDDMISWIKFVQLAKRCAVAHQESVVALLTKLSEGDAYEFINEWFNVDDINVKLLTAVNDANVLVKEKAMELLTIMDVTTISENRWGATSPAARRYLESLGVRVDAQRPRYEEDAFAVTEGINPSPRFFRPMFTTESAPAPVPSPALTEQWRYDSWEAQLTQLENERDVVDRDVSTGAITPAQGAEYHSDIQRVMADIFRERQAAIDNDAIITQQQRTMSDAVDVLIAGGNVGTFRYPTPPATSIGGSSMNSILWDEIAAWPQDLDAPTAAGGDL